MNKKLTLISFAIGGVTKSVFIELEYSLSGHPIIEPRVINSIIEQEFGYIPRGITVSIA